MPQCFVRSCTTTQRKKPKHVKFHKFPANMIETWLEAIGENSDENIPEFSVICSLHFTESDYEYRGSAKRLRKGAIPTMNISKHCNKKLIFDDAELSADSQPSTSKFPSPILIPLSSEPEESGCEYILKDERLRKRIATRAESSSSNSSVTFTDTNVNYKFHTYCKRSKVKEIDSVSTDSSSSRSKTFKTPELFEKSPTKSSSSSVERKRKLTKLFHSYSHSPTYAHKQVTIQKNKNVIIKNKLKYAKKRNKVLKRKVNSLHDILKDLKKKQSLSFSGFSILEQTVSGIPLALMKRLILCTKHSTVRTKYPAELRSFAMTLQFYSPKAYEYVRTTFNHALPHQSVIRSWYSKINCDPGFSTPAFNELKYKVEQEKKCNNQIFCSLMLDEMSIKKHVEFDGKTTRGYIDFGTDIDSDELDEATEALVLMVVAVNGNWKIPVAYFLINKLTGEERANIVRETLIRLHETGIIIMSLTCDGPSVHIKMMKCLGCNVTKFENYFKHPITNEKVFVIFDICHMLKITRNNWARLEKIKDPAGNIINWEFIEKLNNIQEAETFLFGNKLRHKHVQWQKQSMKVRLAAQTLSASVAEALDFLNHDINLSSFKNSESTVQFIKIIDRLFDVLNSRNILASGFKAPVRNENKNFWKPLLEDSIKYLKKCTNLNGQFLVDTRNKTPFIGFIVSSMSFLGMAEEYLETKKLKFLLGYKFSQDHLELFFCAMRCRNGWNNNPTALQFIRSYKRLLLHNNIKNMTGNCIPQDNTNILFVSSVRTVPNSGDMLLLRRRNEEYKQTEEILNLPIHLKLTDISENVVTYISGYVIRMLQKKIICNLCKEFLEEDHIPADDNNFKLLSRKQRGGLKIPSKDVKEVCLYTETKIRNLNFIFKKIPGNKEFISCIVNKTVQYFLEEKPEIFKKTNDHLYDVAADEDLHKKKLIQQTSLAYCKIRYYNLAKRQTEELRGENIRMYLNKVVLFKHQ